MRKKKRYLRSVLGKNHVFRIPETGPREKIEEKTITQPLSMEKFNLYVDHTAVISKKLIDAEKSKNKLDLNQILRGIALRTRETEEPLESRVSVRDLHILRSHAEQFRSAYPLQIEDIDHLKKGIQLEDTIGRLTNRAGSVENVYEDTKLIFDNMDLYWKLFELLEEPLLLTPTSPDISMPTKISINLKQALLQYLENRCGWSPLLLKNLESKNIFYALKQRQENEFKISLLLQLEIKDWKLKYEVHYVCFPIAREKPEHTDDKYDTVSSLISEELLEATPLHPFLYDFAMQLLLTRISVSKNTNNDISFNGQEGRQKDATFAGDYLQCIDLPQTLDQIQRFHLMARYEHDDLFKRGCIRSHLQQSVFEMRLPKVTEKEGLDVLNKLFAWLWTPVTGAEKFWYVRSRSSKLQFGVRKKHILCLPPDLVHYYLLIQPIVLESERILRLQIYFLSIDDDPVLDTVTTPVPGRALRIEDLFESGNGIRRIAKFVGDSFIASIIPSRVESLRSQASAESVAIDEKRTRYEKERFDWSNQYYNQPSYEIQHFNQIPERSQRLGMFRQFRRRGSFPGFTPYFAQNTMKLAHWTHTEKSLECLTYEIQQCLLKSIKEANNMCLQHHTWKGFMKYLLPTPFQEDLVLPELIPHSQIPYDDLENFLESCITIPLQVVDPRLEKVFHNLNNCFHQKFANQIFGLESLIAFLMNSKLNYQALTAKIFRKLNPREIKALAKVLRLPSRNVQITGRRNSYTIELQFEKKRYMSILKKLVHECSDLKVDRLSREKTFVKRHAFDCNCMYIKEIPCLLVGGFSQDFCILIELRDEIVQFFLCCSKHIEKQQASWNAGNFPADVGWMLTYFVQTCLKFLYDVQ